MPASRSKQNGAQTAGGALRLKGSNPFPGAKPSSFYLKSFGLAIISFIFRSKNLEALAGFMSRAVSAPLLLPAMAMMSLSIGMSPASATINVI